MDWVSNWWQVTENLPHIDLAHRAHECCQQILHPAWFDPKDPYKGRALTEQQTRRGKREVRTPLVYLNNQQNTAQAVPETHDVKWKVDEQANPSRLGADPNLKRFANSVRSITKKYVREINGQDILESWVQDAHNFPAAVLKIHFERELAKEPLKIGVEADGQDNLARIQQLSDDIARGQIQRDDRRVIELQDLLAGMGKTAELEVREGLVVQNLDLRGIRFPKIPDLESIYVSPWISHEDLKTKRKLRAGFPYKVLKADEAGNPIEWEGIHPEDLDGARPCSQGDRKNHIDKMRAAPHSTTANTPNANRQQSSSRADEDVELLTREVWDRESGYVYVFVEGIPYPAAKWIPQRTPEQWYPFVFLVLNRVFGQVVGIADSELQGDTQARIHQKQTDLEVARDKCTPKGIIDSSMMDPANVQKIVEFEGYTFKPMPLGGKGIEAMVKMFEFPLRIENYDTAGDYVDLSREASVPPQALGGTGGPDAPKFAKEVEVAAAGSAVSSSFRQSRIRRALDRFYNVCGQILLQEVDQEAALEADDTVLWPQFYGDKEADAAYQQIQQEVRSQVVYEVIQELCPVDPMTGLPDTRRIDPKAVQRVTAEKSQPIIEERCLQQYGLPRPLSRSSLYKMLRVHVVVVQDSEMDKRNRLRALIGGLEAIASIMQSSQSFGIIPNLDPIMRMVMRLSGGDEDIAEEMFSADPNVVAQQLIQSVQAGGQLAPETMAALQQLAVQVAQQSAVPGQAPTQPGQAPAPAAAAPVAPAAQPAPAPEKAPV